MQIKCAGYCRRCQAQKGIPAFKGKGITYQSLAYAISAYADPVRTCKVGSGGLVKQADHMHNAKSKVLV